MAKFSGEIGFAVTLEDKIDGVGTGVWREHVVERRYYGDLVRNTRKLQNSEHLNDNINIANSISIVADPFARQNIYAMRYVRYMGTEWKVSDVEVQYPRLILTIGGEYNNVNVETT